MSEIIALISPKPQTGRWGRGERVSPPLLPLGMTSPSSPRPSSRTLFCSAKSSFFLTLHPASVCCLVRRLCVFAVTLNGLTRVETLNNHLNFTQAFNGSNSTYVGLNHRRRRRRASNLRRSTPRTNRHLRRFCSHKLSCML